MQFATFFNKNYENGSKSNDSIEDLKKVESRGFPGGFKNERHHRGFEKVYILQFLRIPAGLKIERQYRGFEKSLHFTVNSI